jgi:hypothetical protein
MSVEKHNNNIKLEKDFDEIREKSINIIISQTEYSREQAIEGLELLKGDYMAVIREYLGTNNKQNKPKSLNQQIYSEIRNHLY